MDIKKNIVKTIIPPVATVVTASIIAGAYAFIIGFFILFFERYLYLWLPVCGGFWISDWIKISLPSIIVYFVLFISALLIGKRIKDKKYLSDITIGVVTSVITVIYSYFVFFTVECLYVIFNYFFSKTNIDLGILIFIAAPIVFYCIQLVISVVAAKYMYAKKYAFYISICTVGTAYGFISFLFMVHLMDLSFHSVDVSNITWLIPMICYVVLLIAASIVGKRIYVNWRKMDIALTIVVGLVGFAMSWVIVFLFNNYDWTQNLYDWFLNLLR